MREGTQGHVDEYGGGDRTVGTEWSARHSHQVVTVEGISVSRLPERGPQTACASTWLR